MARGRPRAYDKLDIKNRLDSVIEMAQGGATRAQIAGMLGVSVSTLCEWQKDYAEFYEALNAGSAYADGLVENALYKRAMGFMGEDGRYYPPDTTAIIFWLKNRDSATWRDKRESTIDATVSMSEADRALLEKVAGRLKSE